MDKSRSLKPPSSSSMIKLPTHSGLPKFKILGNINNNTTVAANSFQASPTKSNQCSSTSSIIPPPSSHSPALLKRPTSSRTTIKNVTTRTPIKSSGLPKPTPVRQIVSAVSTTTTTKTSQVKTNNTVKKTKALTFNSPQQQTSKNSNIVINTTANIDLSSLTGDFIEIRHLLEDLLKVLNSSNDNNNDLILENQRLKKEILELKETISAMKRSANSSVYYSPQISY